MNDMRKEQCEPIELNPLFKSDLNKLGMTYLSSNLMSQDINNTRIKTILSEYEHFIDFCNSHGGSVLEFANVVLGMSSYSDKDSRLHLNRIVAICYIIHYLYPIGASQDYIKHLSEFCSHFLEVMHAIDDDMPASDYPQFEHLDDARELKTKCTHFINGDDSEFYYSSLISLFNTIGFEQLIEASFTSYELMCLLLLIGSFEFSIPSGGVSCITDQKELSHETERAYFDDKSINAYFFTGTNHHEWYVDELGYAYFHLKRLVFLDYIIPYYIGELPENMMTPEGVRPDSDSRIRVLYSSARIFFSVAQYEVDGSIDKFKSRLVTMPVFSKFLFNNFLSAAKNCHLRKRGLHKKNLIDTFITCMNKKDITAAKLLIAMLIRLNDYSNTLDIALDYDTLHGIVLDMPDEIIKANLTMGDYDIAHSNPTELIEAIHDSKKQCFFKSLFQQDFCDDTYGYITGYTNDFKDSQMQDVYKRIVKLLDPSHDDFWNRLIEVHDSVLLDPSLPVFNVNTRMGDFFKMSPLVIDDYTYSSSQVLQLMETIIGHEDREDRFLRLKRAYHLIGRLVDGNHMDVGLGNPNKTSLTMKVDSGILYDRTPVSWLNADGSVHKVNVPNAVAKRSKQVRRDVFPHEFMDYLMNGTIPETMTSKRLWAWRLLDLDPVIKYSDRVAVDVGPVLRKRWGIKSIPTPMRSIGLVDGSDVDKMTLSLKTLDSDDSALGECWEEFCSVLSGSDDGANRDIMVS
jgi:hypothetical protein